MMTPLLGGPTLYGAIETMAATVPKTAMGTTTDPHHNEAALPCIFVPFTAFLQPPLPIAPI